MRVKNLIKYIFAALLPLLILFWPYMINVIWEIKE